MSGLPAQDLRHPADTTVMIGAVQVKLLSLELNSARDALANAQAVSVQPGGTTVQAEVILELSAAAQALLTQPAS